MSIQTNPYSNPDNHLQIIEDLKEAKTHTEVLSIITNTFPSWMITYSTQYSDDYPVFTNNWNFVCKRTKSKPLDIVIVDFIDLKNTNFSLLSTFCELLTLFGHSVRRKEEFILCHVCKKCIPAEHVYNQLKERNIENIPTIWKNLCQNCK